MQKHGPLFKDILSGPLLDEAAELNVEASKRLKYVHALIADSCLQHGLAKEDKQALGAQVKKIDEGEVDRELVCCVLLRKAREVVGQDAPAS